MAIKAPPKYLNTVFVFIACNVWQKAIDMALYLVHIDIVIFIGTTVLDSTTILSRNWTHFESAWKHPRRTMPIVDAVWDHHIVPYTHLCRYVTVLLRIFLATWIINSKLSLFFLNKLSTIIQISVLSHYAKPPITQCSLSNIKQYQDFQKKNHHPFNNIGENLGK